MAGAVSREKLTAGPPGMWRYRDMLPVNGDVIDLGTGATPLVRAERLGRALGLDELYIKNDSQNPTYSFKDRVVQLGGQRGRPCRQGRLEVLCLCPRQR
jgi:threonine synthase